MNDTDRDTLDTHALYRVSQYLWQCGSPVLILVGTVGNVLSILVLRRPKLRQSTTMFYLTCLSFGDLFTLYTGLLRYWISETFGEDIRNISSVSCKLHTFLVYYSLDITVWILVSVTLDRCVSVSLPFKSKRICTIPKAKLVIIILLLVFLFKNLHFFWTVDLVQTWEYRCDANTPDVEDFLRYVWPWIDLATFCVIPFTIMILANIKMIYEMIISQRKLEAHRSYRGGPVTDSAHFPSPASFPNQSGVSLHSMTTQEHTAVNGISRTDRHMSQASSKARKRIPSLTAMLLTINCVFLITTSPIQAFLIGEEYWFAKRTMNDIAKYKLWWSIVNMLQYLNNAIHFFLYCLTGPRFRDELKAMVSRRNKVAVTVIERTHTDL